MNIFRTIKEKSWQRHVRKVQRELDHVHSIRDYYNRLFNTCYTTKQAIELAFKKDL